jgi:hypothetical protein
MKALFALVLLLDLIVLSGTSVFLAKPIGGDGTARVHSLVVANDTFPEPLSFQPRNHFGL